MVLGLPWVLSWWKGERLISGPWEEGVAANGEVVRWGSRGAGQGAHTP